MSARSQYLKKQLLNHISSFFTEKAIEMVGRSEILFLEAAEARQIRRPAVVVPTDIALPDRPDNPYHIAFNSTKLTLWNRLHKPPDDGWSGVPSDHTPLWYVHSSGTVMPGWNLFGNLFDLLTFGEDRRSSHRDSHGRFCAANSPRMEAGLLEVPAFNEAAAALVGACAGLVRGGLPAMHLDNLVSPPVAVLSHDCDLLLGNDIWTQSVRGFRVFQPLYRGRLPHVGNLWWMVRNGVTPRRFYFDNVTGMVDLERTFDFESTFYLINGSRGRFGARSGEEVLGEAVSVIPPGWPIGMHYNYDTFLNRDRFRDQFDRLCAIVDDPVEVGRAHYLLFDGEQSLKFLQQFGIQCDESAGYADRIGFRCGIGGCFQGYDLASDKPLDIYEVPMVVMDATLQNQYRTDAIPSFRRLVKHLGRVGGAISVIFHPGQFHNPEFPAMSGLYHQLLKELRDVGAVSRPARSLAKGIE